MSRCWFHKWVNLTIKEDYKFLNENCQRDTFSNYRICTKCKAIQEYTFDSQGGSWFSIPKCEENILKQYIDFSMYQLDLPETKPIPSGVSPPQRE